MGTLIRNFALGVGPKPTETAFSDGLVSAVDDLVAVAMDSTIAVQKLPKELTEEGEATLEGYMAELSAQWMTTLPEARGGGETSAKIQGRVFKSLPLTEKFERSIANQASSDARVTQLCWSSSSPALGEAFGRSEYGGPLLGVVTSEKDLLLYAPPTQGEHEPRIIYDTSRDSDLLKQVRSSEESGQGERANGNAEGGRKTKARRRGKKHASPRGNPPIGAKNVAFLWDARGAASAKVVLAVAAETGSGDHRALLCELSPKPAKSGQEGEATFACALKSTLPLPESALLKLMRFEGTGVILGACFSRSVGFFDAASGKRLCSVAIPGAALATCFDISLGGSGRGTELEVAVGLAEGSVGRCKITVSELARGEDAGNLRFEVEATHDSFVSGVCRGASCALNGSLVIGGREAERRGAGQRMGAVLTGDANAVLSLSSVFKKGISKAYGKRDLDVGIEAYAAAAE